MVTIKYEKPALEDATEELGKMLEHIWYTLCDHYDAGGGLPGMQTLFDGVDVNVPRQAAETVIANMLVDLAESISRFSPWYTRPTRAFGLSVFRDASTKRMRCILAPEAIQKWSTFIEPLAVSIRQNMGIIQAAIYVDNLLMRKPAIKDMITACCACIPPHTVQVDKSVLDKGEIYCNVCREPFT